MEDYRIRRIKGDIVEAVCKNHFAAMGFYVENVGVEHFATRFANRPVHQRRTVDGSNISKIEKYIGHLPDFLVGHERHDPHFVEAKFRDGVSIHTFAKALLWDYRNEIFGRELDMDLFRDITKNQWVDEAEAFELGQRAHLDQYMKAVTEGGVKLESIQLPMMFYVLLKESKSFSLFLIYFDAQDGAFQIHQAGKAQRTASGDIATDAFLAEFDKTYALVVAPILRDMFCAELDLAEVAPPEPKHTVPPGSVLQVCLDTALRIKTKTRKGVYFQSLLEEPSVRTWLQRANRTVTKEELKAELEKCGLNSSPVTFTLSEGHEINLSIRDYKVDFDFYMK